MKSKSRKKERRFFRRPAQYYGSPIRRGLRITNGGTAKAVKSLRYFRRKAPLI